MFCEKAIQHNFKPKKWFYFYGKWTLKDAVEKYCRYQKDDINEIALTYGYPINKWDVSQVVDFGGLFKWQTYFNEYIGDWDVHNATTMTEMFRGAKSFNQPLDNWDTSKVNNMRRMFAGAHSFNQPLQNWDISTVNDMKFMFYNARSFNQSLGTWNTGHIKKKKGMFKGTKISSTTTSLPELHEIAKISAPHVEWTTECGEVPDNVAFHIVSFFDVSDVTKSKRVNKSWKLLCEHAIKLNFQPKRAFCGKWELKDTAARYCEHHKDNIDEIGRTYGYPINKWDVSQVEDFSGLFKRQKPDQKKHHPLSKVAECGESVTQSQYMSYNQGMVEEMLIKLTTHAFFWSQKTKKSGHTLQAVGTSARDIML
jgi:surface protein